MYPCILLVSVGIAVTAAAQKDTCSCATLDECNFVQSELRNTDTESCIDQCSVRIASHPREEAVKNCYRRFIDDLNRLYDDDFACQRNRGLCTGKEVKRRQKRQVCPMPIILITPAPARAPELEILQQTQGGTGDFHSCYLDCLGQDLPSQMLRDARVKRAFRAASNVQSRVRSDSRQSAMAYIKKYEQRKARRNRKSRRNKRQTEVDALEANVDQCQKLSSCSAGRMRRVRVSACRRALPSIDDLELQLRACRDRVEKDIIESYRVDEAAENLRLEQEEERGSDSSSDEDEARLRNAVPTAFMEDFFIEVDAIWETLIGIEANSDAMVSLQSSVLSSPFTEEKSRRRLDQLTAQIMLDVQGVRQELSAMESGNERETERVKADANPSPAKLRIRRLQHSAMSQRLYGIMLEHNRRQLSFSDRCKARLRRQMEIAGRSVDEGELEALLDHADARCLTQGIVTQGHGALRTLADIQARHQDLLKLETSIRQLQSLFTDMALVMESQGDLMDSIEHNMERTRNFVVEATLGVKTALKLRKTRRKKKLLCIIFGVGVFTLFLLLIYAWFRTPT